MSAFLFAEIRDIVTDKNTLFPFGAKIRTNSIVDEQKNKENKKQNKINPRRFALSSVSLKTLEN